jgi:hypothetical protein
MRKVRTLAKKCEKIYFAIFALFALFALKNTRLKIAALFAIGYNRNNHDNPTLAVTI